MKNLAILAASCCVTQAAASAARYSYLEDGSLVTKATPSAEFYERLLEDRIEAEFKSTPRFLSEPVLGRASKRRTKVKVYKKRKPSSMVDPENEKPHKAAVPESTPSTTTPGENSASSIVTLKSKDFMNFIMDLVRPSITFTSKKPSENTAAARTDYFDDDYATGGDSELFGSAPVEESEAFSDKKGSHYYPHGYGKKHKPKKWYKKFLTLKKNHHHHHDHYNHHGGGLGSPWGGHHHGGWGQYFYPFMQPFYQPCHGGKDKYIDYTPILLGLAAIAFVFLFMTTTIIVNDNNNNNNSNNNNANNDNNNNNNNNNAASSSSSSSSSSTGFPFFPFFPFYPNVTIIINQQGRALDEEGDFGQDLPLEIREDASTRKDADESSFGRKFLADVVDTVKSGSAPACSKYHLCLINKQAATKGFVIKKLLVPLASMPASVILGTPGKNVMEFLYAAQHGAKGDVDCREAYPECKSYQNEPEEIASALMNEAEGRPSQLIASSSIPSDNDHDRQSINSSNHTRSADDSGIMVGDKSGMGSP